jgi:hypothetical protein
LGGRKEGWKRGRKEERMDRGEEKKASGKGMAEGKKGKKNGGYAGKRGKDGAGRRRKIP